MKMFEADNQVGLFQHYKIYAKAFCESETTSPRDLWTYKEWLAGEYACYLDLVWEERSKLLALNSKPILPRSLN